MSAYTPQRASIAPADDVSHSQMPPPPAPVMPSSTPTPSPLPSVESSVTPAPSRASKKSRFVWKPHHTRFFLEQLVECRNQGLLNTDRSALLLRAMETIIPQLERRWPHANWGAQRLLDHYKNLRAKHGKYLWMVRRTGVVYRHETGIIVASRDQWREFYNRYGDKQTWLENNGLPHAELYDFVFEGNEPAGTSIAEASNRSGLNSIDLTMVREDQSDQDGGDEAGENDEERDTPSGREGSQLSWTPSPTPTRALSSPVIRGTRRSASALSDSSPRQRPLKRLKGPRSNLDELAKSIRHHTDSCAQLFRQSERERGVDDIERAVDDGKKLFSLAGRQLALFIKKMATPLQAVCWNMAGDDIEAKKAFLREMLGEDDVDRLVIEDM